MTTVLVGLLLATAGACAGSDGAPAATTVPPRPVIAASTPLVGALVRSVVGDQADVRVLVDPAADPAHPADDDTDLILGPDLLVRVDPTYEVWLAPMLAAAEGATFEVLTLAPELNPIPLGGSELDGGPSGPPGPIDPHVWLDPDRWTQAARLVADAVISLPGVDAAEVQANVAAVDDALARADEHVQAAMATLPADRRTVVTDLPAMAYLADRYGLDLELVVQADELAGAAGATGATVVFTADDRRDDVAASLATTAPGVAVVGVELDRPPAADGPAAAADLLTTAATTVVTGLAG